MTGQAISDDKKEYILRTTCNKNGGFRFYVPLPPQRVFQKAYWVLGSELEVRIKRKTTFFNRETKWMRVPIYLTTNKGLLFVYITEKSGYILRVPCATKLYFEGTKKPKKLPKDKILEGSKYNYIATMQLTYNFGELHIRFDDEDNLRPWRAIMLAAHQTPQGLAKAGVQVAQEVCKSASAESVVSTKSIAPDGKSKDDEIRLRRYAAFPRKSVSEISLASRTTSEVSTHVNFTAAITSARASASGTSIMSNVSRLSRVSGMPTENVEFEAEPLVTVPDDDAEEAASRARAAEARAYSENLYKEIMANLTDTKSTLSSEVSAVEDDATKPENDENDENDDITQSPVSVSAISNSTVDRCIRDIADAISVSSEVDVEVASSASNAAATEVTAIEDVTEHSFFKEKTPSDSSVIPLMAGKFNILMPMTQSVIPLPAAPIKSDISIHTAVDPDEDRAPLNPPSRKVSFIEPTKTSVMTFVDSDTSDVSFLSGNGKPTATAPETAITTGRKPGILRPISQNAPATGTVHPVGANNLRNRLDFWRNQELVRGNTAPIHTKPVILGKTVQQKVKFINAKNDDHPGKVVTSPTRYFATVEDAAAAVEEKQELESHI